MAYMDQERKAKIAKNLKEVVPRSWKYSLAVRHHSSIVMTIMAAPVDLTNGKDYVQVNVYHPDVHFVGGTLETMRNIIAVLNDGNHDRSEPQVDYFDVGWYVNVDIGKWNRPFEVI